MKEQLKLHIDQLAKTVDSIDWKERETCAAFLAQTYYYVRHSTRLLALAASRFEWQGQKAHRRFLKHIGEEVNHELLAERDIQALGLKLSDVPELAATRAFYQVQYAMIEHETPWAMCGYILFLEAAAVARAGWIASEMKKYHGDKTGSFFKVHAEEDVAHLDEIWGLIDQAPEFARQSIKKSLETSAYLYCQSLLQCSVFKVKQSNITYV